MGRLLLAFALAWFASGSVIAQGYSADEAVERMSIANGFDVQVIASEPLVRQPVCIEFDDRGRLWVIQYLQYPNPEGLRRVQVDRFSRTQYDRVPRPPPHGPRGADRITILSDEDGDGRMDAAKDFVSGLNLASGMVHGHGGVFVLNVPYLLFYPDQDRNDVPDSDPQVLLTGFGMQDAHSVANSLTWGPDGWLYGCQGSTVTSEIRGIEFQQGVWRYHRETDRFELFCEGGGNSWGLDFDRVGNLFYSTNYGGYVFVHGVQGGYYVKSFGKHGALHNPHTYGFFEHAPHKNFVGGHVTVGGLVYQGDSFPSDYRGKYIAADLLGHAVRWHEISTHGSTFQTATGGELLQANDSWFAPTDMTLGPDGAIYVSDWHDARTAHPDPDAQWDRTNGRIYRISAKGTSLPAAIDFARLSTKRVIELHENSNQWYVRRARQELVRRKDASAVDQLRRVVQASIDGSNATDESKVLESFWSLLSLNAVDDKLAIHLLESHHASIRSWAVRYFSNMGGGNSQGGESGKVSNQIAHRLDELAEQEPDLSVRQQLACTAARLPAHQGVPIVNANINRDIDNEDPFLPLLWWWAIERHSVSGRDEVMNRFVRPSLWRSQLGSRFLLPKLIRRYVSEGSREGLDSVMRLLDAAPDKARRNDLWEPILLGLRESTTQEEQSQRYRFLASHPLGKRIVEAWRQDQTQEVLLRLAVVLGHAEAAQEAVRIASDPARKIDRRVRALETLSLLADPSLIDPIIEVVDSDPSDAVRVAALNALAHHDEEWIALHLIEVHATSASDAWKRSIRDALLSRKSSALAWLRAVDRGAVAASETPIDQIRRVALLDDPRLDELVAKHWGRIQAATREEKLAEVRRLNNDLRAGPGDAGRGKKIFNDKCAICHQLFGEGKKVGPDLTSANRADRNALLVSLVDPSSVIRKEYLGVVVATTDGRVLSGLPVGDEEGAMTLIDGKGGATTIARGEIDSIRESSVSLMPDDLYRTLDPQQLRDLFAWLQSTDPRPLN